MWLMYDDRIHGESNIRTYEYKEITTEWGTIYCLCILYYIGTVLVAAIL